MYESEKLDEAEYFLQQMAKCRSDRLLHKYNLSAFLFAARSVLQFANNEAVSKLGGQTWYDGQVRNNPIAIFFKDRRDCSIHNEPVRPINEIQMHIEETLHFDDMAEAMVIRYDNPGPSKVQLPNWPHSSKVTMSGTCRFKEWNGPEDLPTLCSLYLGELRKIVADGQSKGFLTP